MSAPYSAYSGFDTGLTSHELQERWISWSDKLLFRWNGQTGTLCHMGETYVPYACGWLKAREDIETQDFNIYNFGE